VSLIDVASRQFKVNLCMLNKVNMLILFHSILIVLFAGSPKKKRKDVNVAVSIFLKTMRCILYNLFVLTNEVFNYNFVFSTCNRL